jgi:hypothetical protein
MINTQKPLELFDVLLSLRDKASDGLDWSFHTVGAGVPKNKAEYDAMAIFTGGNKPSWEEVEAEIPVIAKKIEDEAYIYKRAEEYPELVDQLDMIFHGGVEEWKAQIQAIKDKYPKPTA